MRMCCMSFRVFRNTHNVTVFSDTGLTRSSRLSEQTHEIYIIMSIESPRALAFVAF